MSQRLVILSVLAAAALAPTSSAPAIEPAAAAVRVDAAMKHAAPRATPPLLDDAAWLRRLTLDLTGRIPSPGALTLFVIDPDQHKRGHKVDELLASSDFAGHWGRRWRDEILARASDRRLQITLAAPVEDWFAAQFAAGRGWHQTVADLLGASGRLAENPAAAFVVAHRADPERLAAETARLFLSVRLECAQCHDHPTDGWKRRDFHELAAFFPRLATDIQAKGSRPDPGAFSRETSDQGDPLEYLMPDARDPQARKTQLDPRLFLAGEPLGTGQTDLARRSALARELTAAPAFARAFVNRVWGAMLGVGLVEPLDDMGPHAQIAFPEVLDILSEGFRASGHDVRWLIRSIAATEAYARQSAGDDSDATPAARPVRLNGEELAGVLSQALGAPIRARNPNLLVNLKQARGPVTDDLVELFSRAPGSRSDEAAGTVPQALFLMNSTTVHQALASGRTLADLLARSDDEQTVLTELYLRVLAREPSAAELATCRRYLSKVADRREALEDILWSLVNSSEFRVKR